MQMQTRTELISVDDHPIEHLMARSHRLPKGFLPTGLIVAKTPRRTMAADPGYPRIRVGPMSGETRRARR